MMMGSIDNSAVIERLNQRGGRMLSAADLVEAGTINTETAGFLARLMERNPSFVSCAGPGGAGKTALMGALLALLPENVSIIPHGESPDVPENSCVAAHEINSTPFYGYIRGEDAGRFLHLASRKRNISVCTTAHADSPSELEELLSREHGIRAGILQSLDFLAFINFFGGVRKLASLYQPDGSAFRKVCSYNSRTGAWEKASTFDWRRLGAPAAWPEPGFRRPQGRAGKLH